MSGLLCTDKTGIIMWVKEKQVLKLPPVLPQPQWERKGRLSSPEGSASRSRHGRVSADGEEGAEKILFQKAGGFLRKYILPSLAKVGRAGTASSGSQRGNVSSMDWVGEGPVAQGYPKEMAIEPLLLVAQLGVLLRAARLSGAGLIKYKEPFYPFKRNAVSQSHS